MPKTPEQFKTPEENQDAILTPSEIGALSPRVPRTPEMLKDAPKPEWHKIYDGEGKEIMYRPEQAKGVTPGTSFIHRGDRAKKHWVFKGLTKESGLLLTKDEGEVRVVDASELEAAYERIALIYVEKNKEGKEVKVDLQEVWQESVGFYTAHNLPEFVHDLPLKEKLCISSRAEARLREALKEGFDKAVLLPSTELQKGSTDKLLAEAADKEFAGLPKTEQYTKHYMWESDVTKKATPRDRPSKKAYLLLYQSGPVPDETKGLSPADKPAQGGNTAKIGLDTLFQQKKWNGLTFEEYLLIQRKELEARKNHSFDAWDDNTSKSQWTWLLDSRVPRGVAHVHWDPGSRRVRVGWDASGGSGGRLGARPAVVVEIEL